MIIRTLIFWLAITIPLTGCSELLEAIVPSEKNCCCYNPGQNTGSWITKKTCSSDNPGTTCVSENFPNAELICGTPPSSSLNRVLQDYARTNASVKLFRSIPTSTTAARTSSCPKECADNGSFCLKAYVPKDQKAVSEGIETTVRWLTSDSWRLSKSETMTALGATSDPCDRTDFFRTESVLSNLGEECKIQTNVSSGETGNAVIVAIPRMLAAVHSQPAGLHHLEFPATSAPSLTFSRNDYQNDFGGKISSVDIAANYAIIETETGCIELTTK